MDSQRLIIRRDHVVPWRNSSKQICAVPTTAERRTPPPERAPRSAHRVRNRPLRAATADSARQQTPTSLVSTNSRGLRHHKLPPGCTRDICAVTRHNATTREVSTVAPKRRRCQRRRTSLPHQAGGATCIQLTVVPASHPGDCGRDEWSLHNRPPRPSHRADL